MKINLDDYSEKDFEEVLKNNPELSQQFNKTINQVQIFNETITKILPNYKINYKVPNFLNQEAFEKIAELSKKNKEISKNLREAFERIYKPLSMTLIPIFKEIEKRRKIQAVPPLFPYMWAIPPNFSSEKLKELIFLTFLNLEVSQEDIDEFFISYFKENDFRELWNLYGKWETYLSEERKKIIHDVFVLISKRDLDINIYPIVIPTLIAQIDGLIVEKLGYRAGFKEKKARVEEFLDIFLKENVNENNDIVESYLYVNFKLFSEKFFQDSKEAEKENNHFNRHLIMHGNVTNYGTEANLYRTIVILDFIITVLYIENIDLKIF